MITTAILIVVFILIVVWLSWSAYDTIKRKVDMQNKVDSIHQTEQSMSDRIDRLEGKINTIGTIVKDNNERIREIEQLLINDKDKKR